MIGRNRMRAYGVAMLAAVALGALTAIAQPEEKDPRDALTEEVTQGALRITQKDGGVVECPLKHTDVEAVISGFIARVKVTQTFHNPLDEKIEAVYVFPLPHKAAVDDMTMVVGDRRIVGLIQRRAAAREIYEAALAQGATAALLEQERPNIFTQSVGNIAPGQEVLIEISYLDVLEYDMGTYEFHFPMVVGPRYIPGGATSTIPPVPPELHGKVGELDKTRVVEGPDKPKGTGWAPDTDRVPDASRITPPVLKPGFRNGHDVSLSLELDAGVPIQNIESANHKATIAKTGATAARAALDPGDTIPNKDFVLRYGVVGEKPAMAVLPYADLSGNGYFMLMIQPKEDEKLKQMPPREIVFLVDVSGSMRGDPTAKVKEEMSSLLKLCKTADTVQVITFASRANKLFEAPVPVTQDNITKALDFMNAQQGGGGTEMLKGVKMAINEPVDPERLRIVIMLSDGFIGNEAEIMAEVGRSCGDKIRFWCIGIGSSPNRFLIDGVARQGGGMSKVLELGGNASELAEEIMLRIHRAQLANISIDWGKHIVYDTYPAKVPELWAERPVIIFGRYDPDVAYGGRFDKATIEISGEVEGEPTSWSLDVTLPGTAPDHEVLAKVWARRRIEDLMQSVYYGYSPEVEEAVTAIALDYSLMSQYTSFVAVDETTAKNLKEPARPPRRMLVPVPIPEGTQYEGFFGDAYREMDAIKVSAMNAMGALTKEVSRPMAGDYMRSFRRSEVSARAFAANGVAFAGRPLSRARGGRIAGPAALRKPLAAPSAPARGTERFYFSADTEMLVDGAMVFNGRVNLGVNMGYLLREDGPELLKAAQQVLEQAEAARKKPDLLVARALFTWAYLLDSAAASLGHSNGETGGKALEAIEEMNTELVKSWNGMDSRLDLVLRDQSILDALQAVARAAGTPIEFADRSVQDAAALLGRKDLRITWLDLRNATVAQALDWILIPNRMTWQVEGERILAGAARRMSGETAWVYDVSMIALPTEDELKDVKERDKRMQAVKTALTAFRDAARADLELPDANAVWYGPGQLLIYADAKTHEKAAGKFFALGKVGVNMTGKLSELHRLTVARATERGEDAAKALDAREQMGVALALDRFSWQLLSAAAQGKLDDESLTELRIAWRRPEIAEVVKQAPALALRSCWAIRQADGALPREMDEMDELAALALAVSNACRPIADEAVLNPKAPEKPADLLSVLYAELAFRGIEGWPSRPRPAFERKAPTDPALKALYVVRDILLAPDGKTDANALMDLLRTQADQLRGDDMVVLTALACRRAGGDAWRAWRENSRDLLGHQPLSGSVVTLVTNLSKAPLPAVAIRE